MAHKPVPSPAWATRDQPRPPKYVQRRPQTPQWNPSVWASMPHPTRAAASLQQEEQHLCGREQAVGPTEQNKRYLCHTLSVRLSAQDPPPFHLELSYRRHPCLKPVFRPVVHAEGEHGQKGWYLRDDVAVLCMDLGDRTDIPDHTQYLVDLAGGSWSQRQGLPSSCSQNNPLPVASGIRTGTLSSLLLQAVFLMCPRGNASGHVRQRRTSQKLTKAG